MLMQTPDYELARTAVWSRPVWSAVFTQPNCERRAQAGIEDIGLGTFLPTYVIRGVFRGRLREVERVLFPRFLFILMQPEDMMDWSRINDVPAVARFLERAGRPLQIPDDDMQRLMLAHATGEFNKVRRISFNGDRPKRRKPRNSHKLKKVRGILNEALALSRKG